jgi:tetratricopeptide (TPR) repeat protein
MTRLAQLPRFERSEPAEGRAPRLRTRYYAFLSYSHRDRDLADWLHRELERFRVPRSLEGKLTATGVVPRRLTPIFRDQHDLSAGDDLAVEIEAALAASQFLVVLCSPTAAKSRWTNLEIESFKRTRPEGCVLAAIVAGEPFASDTPGREEEECFPPALRYKYDRRGHRTSKKAEPLAADFREIGDGKRIAFLKLVAGMLGVGLDELVQRDQTRRQRRLAALAAASLAGMAVTSTLAVTSIQARDEARDQRREAESLVGFMLGDLKDKLEPLGRLDVLDSVGAKALAYYQKQDTSRLSNEALAQRSRALTLLGQVASTRGDLDEAVRFYRAAFAGTAEALRRSPDDPQRIFDHAQNVFYLADIAHTRGQLKPAESGLQEYKRLARRMIEIDPSNPKWQMEGIYADTNLGVILNDEGRYDEAAATFENARGDRQRLAAGDPSNVEYKKALIESLGWLSTARERQGRLDDALSAREQQIQILAPLISDPHADAGYEAQAIGAYRAAGRINAERGDIPKSVEQFQSALQLAARLEAVEPSNTETREMATWANFGLARTKLAANAVDEAAALITPACDATDRLIARDGTVVEWRLDLRSSCLELQARLALARNNASEAGRYADDLLAAAKAESARTHSQDAAIAEANAWLMKGLALRAAGNGPMSTSAFKQASASWPAGVADRASYMARRVVIFKATGRTAEANALAQRLAAVGFADPLYLRDARSVG